MASERLPSSLYALGAAHYRAGHLGKAIAVENPVGQLDFNRIHAGNLRACAESVNYSIGLSGKRSRFGGPSTASRTGSNERR